jgi:hypothetical protein|tara:strand:- start:1097 stop:1312 length:216 start_codon:yes stop_codon:yes gene_type:complete
MCPLQNVQSASPQLAVTANAVTDYRVFRKGTELVYLQPNPHQHPLSTLLPLQLMSSAAFLTDFKARSISSD